MKCRFHIVLGVTLALFLAAIGSSHADVIYSQPPEYGPEAGGWVSDLNRGEEAADDFLLEIDSYVTDVHWWGLHVGDPWYDFSIRLYPHIDEYGEPDGEPFWQGAPQNLTVTSDEPYSYYSADLGDTLLLQGNTTYYISIVATSGPSISSIWGWAWHDEPGEFWYRESPDTDWTGVTDPEWAFQLAFELTGTPIPEPTTMLMLGGLGAGLAAARKLRRKK